MLLQVQHSSAGGHPRLALESCGRAEAPPRRGDAASRAAFIHGGSWITTLSSRAVRLSSVLAPSEKRRPSNGIEAARPCAAAAARKQAYWGARTVVFVDRTRACFRRHRSSEAQSHNTNDAMWRAAGDCATAESDGTRKLATTRALVVKSSSLQRFMCMSQRLPLSAPRCQPC